MFGALKTVSSGVLASCLACDVRAAVRLGYSLAAALLETRFERAGSRTWLYGLFLCFLWMNGSVVLAHDEVSDMTRRQQGILTGMPFMAHVSSRSFIDDAGRKIYLAKTPSRIVSLAPSVTEMLFAIGAGEQLVGVTDFCDYPPEALTKPKVGYANPNLESLMALRPDLVLAPQEFLKPDVILKLEQLKVPVFILSATTVEDILGHLQTLGRMLDRSVRANEIAMSLRQDVAAVRLRTQKVSPVRVLYVLNSQPLITVGPGSFIDQLLRIAGGTNVAAQSQLPYPRLSLEVVLRQDPEVLLFPIGKAEGIPDSEQQTWRQWQTMTAVRRGRLHQIPADLLNRPGPRIGQALTMLVNILHPEIAAVPSSQP